MKIRVKGKMRHIWLSLILACAYGKIQNDALPSSLLSSENELTPVQMITHEKYRGEEHEVVTEDGYVLTLHRIRGAAGSVGVYLQHGMLESSADWLTPGRGRSLAYILADRGYDVWLGNFRGNAYSNRHATLNTTDPQFWRFSWQEIGSYDLPAALSYVTKLKKSRIIYIGHSMGASTFSVAAIERPEIARKVEAMIALAPANYVYHIKGPVKMIAHRWSWYETLANSLGLQQFAPRTGNDFFDYLSRNVCKSTLRGKLYCGKLLLIFGGFSPRQLNYSLLPKIYSKFPSGTSMKLIIHWLQQIHANRFAKFDYGPERNLELYNGTTTPPEYDLSRMLVPTAVFWGDNDWLVDPRDAQQFYDRIPVKLGIHRIEEEGFNHFDFLWGVDAPKVVYPRVLSILAGIGNQVSS